MMGPSLVTSPGGPENCEEDGPSLVNPGLGNKTGTMTSPQVLGRQSMWTGQLWDIVGSLRRHLIRKGESLSAKFEVVGRFGHSQKKCLAERGIVTQCMLSKLGIGFQKNNGQILIVALHWLSVLVTKVDGTTPGNNSGLLSVDVWAMCPHGSLNDCILGLWECSWDYTGRLAVKAHGYVLNGLE
ncbi:hypothetical protein L1987_24839 [Smallanthus sonchifolius]|uniref:Uncharacterized protein n=1 Tax=Smallanthus sonchifolius TaxID=185202 RepID=A0ACB9IN15_9ASTR|nr:hypothetical protein L1987_24839 [Smallanthus sonchifolius]